MSDVRRSWRTTRNARDANPPRPNVVILNPPTAWRPLRGRMQTLRVFPGYCCTAAVHGEEAFEKQSGRRDLNPRPLDPQIPACSSALSVRPSQCAFDRPWKYAAIRPDAGRSLYFRAVQRTQGKGTGDAPHSRVRRSVGIARRTLPTRRGTCTEPCVVSVERLSASQGPRHLAATAGG